jgi:hypothetical protein
MKLSPLTCVQVLLAVAVVVSIFTMNITVLILTVVLSAVVGGLYWWRNRRNKKNRTKHVPVPVQHKVPKVPKINTIHQDPQDPQDNQTQQTQQTTKKEPISYEPLSTRVSRDIASRKLFDNLPEPPNARYDALRAAYKSAGPLAIGLKPSVSHMRNIRPV